MFSQSSHRLKSDPLSGAGLRRRNVPTRGPGALRARQQSDIDHAEHPSAAYFERTGNSELMRSIWRNIELALDWIDNFGDRDGDGFVEYARLSSNGLRWS